MARNNIPDLKGKFNLNICDSCHLTKAVSFTLADFLNAICIPFNRRSQLYSGFPVFISTLNTSFGEHAEDKT